MKVEMNEGDMVVDAALLGKLLDIAPHEVPVLLRAQKITSLCERGIEGHAGEYRLSFFYGSRRARLSVDEAGNVLRRSVIDFGDAAMPRQLHRPGT
ncbi:hypothetical protein ATER59S_02653 [Aquamicrobium terrae]